ncbi:MAG: imidazole glycerol phosphate synthase subunit HisH [Actinomycetota bacterium]|nr:imidazole glycerol phosphate synthase subunit HisH [Actinomycetota bacterium]
MIAILDYGMGNLRSVLRAVTHVGGEAEITGDADAVRKADALVVPGVGHFGACMRNLVERGLAEPLKFFTGTGRLVLGVCLGMQVLFERSEEDDTPGLGLIPGRSRRLPPSVRVPHMGWNSVRWIEPHPYVAGIPNGTSFYFAHSFAPDVAAGTTVGATEYGRTFSSAVTRGNLFATQFHPEKSGEAGLALYEAFVKETR